MLDNNGRVLSNGNAEPLANRTMNDEDSILNRTKYTNGSWQVFDQNRINNETSVGDLNNELGIYEINLNSSVTSKLQEGPNLLKIFANTNEALRPDIFTAPILIVRR
jgi:hypothetical protein